jgi:hypothetical protein
MALDCKMALDPFVLFVSPIRANAIPVNDKDTGGGNVNCTMAGGEDAFSFLADYDVPSAAMNATIGLSHSMCTTPRTSLNEAKTFMMHPDSGTDFHMSGDKLIFLELTDLAEEISVSFGNGQYLSARQKGRVQLTKEVILSGVLYVEGLTVNLISTTATPWTYGWTIDPDQMILRNQANPRTIYCIAKRQNGLYNAVFSRANIGLVDVTRAQLVDIMALHRRLGHAGKSTMGKIIAKGLGGSVRASDLKSFDCLACIKGNGTRLPLSIANPSIKRASSPLEQISVDIWGPARIPSAGGASYFVTIIHDYSQHLEIHPIKAKSEAFAAIQRYISKWENQLDLKVKTMRSDGGAVFGAGSNGSITAKVFLRDKGIIHTVVPASNHAQNGGGTTTSHNTQHCTHPFN